MAALIMCLVEVLDDDDGNQKLTTFLFTALCKQQCKINTTPIIHFMYFLQYIVEQDKRFRTIILRLFFSTPCKLFLD